MGGRNSKVSPQASYSISRETSDIGESKIEDSPGISNLKSPTTSVSTPKIATRGPPLNLISHIEKVSPKSVADSDDASRQQSKYSSKKNRQFKAGDKILGNFDGKGEWYPGVIMVAYDDFVYDVEYDDGDIEESVPSTDIKARPKGTLGPLNSQLSSSNVSYQTPIRSHQPSNIVRVQSSSKLESSEDDHTRSFQQLPINEKNAKPGTVSEGHQTSNKEVDDYGEYDGSLDFVPRVASKICIRMTSTFADDEDDDEFAQLDEEESQKKLTKSLLTGERNDSVVIKNLYREDSKNMLLSTPLHEDRNALDSKREKPYNTDQTSTENCQRCTEDYYVDGKISSGIIDDDVVPDARIYCNVEKEDCFYQEKSSIPPTDNIEHAVDNHYDVGALNISSRGQYQHGGGENDHIETSLRDSVSVDDKYTTVNSENRKIDSTEEVKHIGLTDQPVAVMQDHQDSSFQDAWGDDDFFGMNGMNIARVDSVESLDGCGGGVANTSSHYIGYEDTERNHLQEQDYDDTKETRAYGNDSLFDTNSAEQSHSESCYSLGQEQYQSGPDWGHISEQSSKLYNYTQEENEKVSQDNCPTDSGWSLCHTADGTPYFYSYELQESRWEIPTYNMPPLSTHSPTQERIFQPSNGFSRPHTTTSGRPMRTGVAQSKHELAKSLNSNKAKSTLHLTNVMEDDDDDTPYDLGLGSIGGIGAASSQPLKKISSASQLKDLRLNGTDDGSSAAAKGLKRPQSMAAMRRKKKNVEF